MDFFERLFHINLDGGSGSLEATSVIVFTAAAIALVAAARRMRRAVKSNAKRI